MEKIKEVIKKFNNTGLFDIFASSILVKVIGFLSSIILIRVVTKEAFGTFTVAWNIYSIAMLASGFGASYAILQIGCETYGNKEEKQLVYNYGLSYGLKSNIIICGLVVLISIFFPFAVKKAAPLMLMMTLLPMLQFCVDYQAIFLRVERFNRKYALYNILNVSFVLLFSLLGAFFVQEKGFIIGRYISFFMLIIIGMKIWNIPYGFNYDGFDDNKKKDFHHISWISMFNGGISQLLFLIDVFVIGIVIPDETVVASYKVATIIPTALSFIPSSLVTYIFPYFAENRNNGKWCLKRYLQITATMSAVNGVITVLLCALAPLIISLMYGMDYLDAVSPFRVLSISYFFSGTFRTIAGNLLVTQRKLKFNSIVAVVSGILNIIADVYLILNYGSIGAAFATLIIVVLCSLANAGYLIYTFVKLSD